MQLGLCNEIYINLNAVCVCVSFLFLHFILFAEKKNKFPVIILKTIFFKKSFVYLILLTNLIEFNNLVAKSNALFWYAVNCASGYIKI